MIVLPTGPAANTIRRRIMAVLLARFAAQVAGVGDAIITWDVISDKPLSADEISKGYAIGVYDTSEKKKDITNATECFLNVVMEFHVRIADGDNMTDVLRAVMGEVQRVAQVDLNTKEPDCYQLTVDVQEMGNELENIAPQTLDGAGVVVFTFRYRHVPGKPWLRR